MFQHNDEQVIQRISKRDVDGAGECPTHEVSVLPYEIKNNVFMQLKFLRWIINPSRYICLCSLENSTPFSGRWNGILQCTFLVLYMYLTLKCGIIFQRTASRHFMSHKIYISNWISRTQSLYKRLQDVKYFQMVRHCGKWYQGGSSREFEGTYRILRESFLNGWQWNSEWWALVHWDCSHQWQKTGEGKGQSG